MNEQAAALRRLQSQKVSYMELVTLAGSFSCGNCRFATPESFCINRSVNAPVSSSHGCCSLFKPAISGDELQPYQWEAFR